jgi:hypothetical protein
VEGLEEPKKINKVVWSTVLKWAGGVSVVGGAFLVVLKVYNIL